MAEGVGGVGGGLRLAADLQEGGVSGKSSWTNLM